MTTDPLLCISRWQGEKGPHLVVAPSSVLENWRREIVMWCPAIKVLLYAGSEAEREAIRDEVKHGYGEHGGGDYVVLLTSYSLFSSSTDNSKRERRWLSRRAADGYLVLDEAQQVRECRSFHSLPTPSLTPHVFSHLPTPSPAFHLPSGEECRGGALQESRRDAVRAPAAAHRHSG